MADVKSQLSGVGKGVVKQVIQEPLEILKDVGEQVGMRPEPGGQHQPQGEQRQEIKVSPEQKRRGSRLAAMEQEIKEIRQQREQTAVEEQTVEEEKKKQQEEHLGNAQKESIFQKGLKMVTGRLKRRMETRLPKAA